MIVPSLLFAGFNFAQTRHFYLPERAGLVEELLNEMDSNATRHDTFGVLLSGPNGVGKSGVGFGSFLCCMAQGRFVVFIPNAVPWVEAAQRSHQQGDEYFLEQFSLQNADLIAATPALHKVFAQCLPLPGTAAHLPGRLIEKMGTVNALGSTLYQLYTGSV
jgi:hypothetical protein